MESNLKLGAGVSLQLSDNLPQSWTTPLILAAVSTLLKTAAEVAVVCVECYSETHARITLINEKNAAFCVEVAPIVGHINAYDAGLTLIRRNRMLDQELGQLGEKALRRRASEDPYLR